jgi:hypothetical protein
MSESERPIPCWKWKTFLLYGPCGNKKKLNGKKKKNMGAPYNMWQTKKRFLWTIFEYMILKKKRYFLISL